MVRPDFRRSVRFRTDAFHREVLH
jgi:hypothetical protein